MIKDLRFTPEDEEYACELVPNREFRFTTALMLRWIAPEIIAAAGPKAFGDAFGAI